MPPVLHNYDHAQRVREKQEARGQDNRHIESGEKSREQINAENGAFAFPRHLIRIPSLSKR